jgi:hypothetical protein
MPGEIWDHAVAQACQFGVCKVARAVGLDYTALRKKLATAREVPILMLPTFVELPGGLFAEEGPIVPLQETLAAGLPNPSNTRQYLSLGLDHSFCEGAWVAMPEKVETSHRKQGSDRKRNADSRVG